MNIIFINVPKTAGEVFEKNFDGHVAKIKNDSGRIYSVGHSWPYPTKIKGWLDWDNQNSKLGEYNNVMTYSIPSNTNIATIIRNPFDILIDYYNEDWAWCKQYQETSTFEKFVDSYLDESVGFHVPSFKKSLFTQLKDEKGEWLIDSKSFVLRYEQLTQDLNIFSKMTGVRLTTLPNKSPIIHNWTRYYREDQIIKLSKLWKSDLEYLGYSSQITDFGDNFDEESLNISKPRVAICFSGEVRDLDHTKDFWLDLISKYDADVYASFWDTENIETNDTIDNFKMLYNPKAIEVEKYNNFKTSTLDVITPQITPPTILLDELINYSKEFHTLSMWYRIWKCNMLSKNFNEDYDIVIRARTDSYLEGEFELVKNNMFNVPVGRVYTDNFPKSDGINDIFSYGPPKVMDYVSSTFLNLMRYLNDGHYMIPPEYFLHVHLNEVDLNIRFFANRLIVTRKSKGRDDELYNRNTDMVEEIKPSNFMDPTPNKNMVWIKPLRDSLNF